MNIFASCLCCGRRKVYNLGMKLGYCVIIFAMNLIYNFKPHSSKRILPNSHSSKKNPFISSHTTQSSIKALYRRQQCHSTVQVAREISGGSVRFVYRYLSAAIPIFCSVRNVNGKNAEDHWRTA